MPEIPLEIDTELESVSSKSIIRGLIPFNNQVSSTKHSMCGITIMGDTNSDCCCEDDSLIISNNKDNAAQIYNENYIKHCQSTKSLRKKDLWKNSKETNILTKETIKKSFQRKEDILIKINSDPEFLRINKMSEKMESNNYVNNGNNKRDKFWYKDNVKETINAIISYVRK